MGLVIKFNLQNVHRLHESASRTNTMELNRFSFSIDRGGTFTDVYAQCPNGKVRVMKLLSEDPANYQDAPREAIKRIIQEVVITCIHHMADHTLHNHTTVL